MFSSLPKEQARLLNSFSQRHTVDVMRGRMSDNRLAFKEMCAA